MLPRVPDVLWEPDVCRFKGLSIALAIVQDVSVVRRQPEVDELRRSIEEKVRASYTLSSLKDVPYIRAYRDFFWRMGIDPTKHRPASEALIRRILRGQSIPRILNVVDLYNIASVETLVTMSAYDLEKVSPPLSIRFAKPSEEVVLIGARRMKLTGHELVLADSEKVLCVYVHGDVDECKVTEDTRNLLLVAYGAPGVSPSSVREGLEKAVGYIIKYAGGSPSDVSLHECLR
ncbi:MAG: hypothetical protein DRN99_00715 [Thermoproteota archaeon]|nr:MAG: hypothetical protein DRN99_00715 [Candidatus Korarchaeota archaeon]